MVEVTRLNGQKMIINGDLVERIEALPDTMVSLSSGRKLIVRESVAEVVRLLTEYRRTLLADTSLWPFERGACSQDLIPEAI